MPNVRIRLLFVLLLLGAASPVSAQEPVIQSDETQALLQGVKRSLDPATLALEYRDSLALSPTQVGQLSALSTRGRRVVEEYAEQLQAVMRVPLSPGDTAAIRARYHRQADVQADFHIQSMVLQHRMDGILSAEQRERLRQIQFRVLRSRALDVAKPR